MPAGAASSPPAISRGQARGALEVPAKRLVIAANFMVGLAPRAGEFGGGERQESRESGAAANSWRIRSISIR